MKARSLLAVALAAMLVPALAWAKPAAQAPAPMSSGVSLGGFLGYEQDDLEGVSLRFDMEFPFQALSPQVDLSWVGSIGYSHLDEDRGGFGFAAEFNADILKFIPAARFTFHLNPQFSLFADAGLGLYYASTELDTNVLGVGSVDDDEVNLIMRIGGGLFFNVNPSTRLGAMIEFDPYFGDFDQTTFIFQVGAMFRL